MRTTQLALQLLILLGIFGLPLPLAALQVSGVSPSGVSIVEPLSPLSACQQNCTYYSSSNATGTTTCSQGDPCTLQEIITNKLGAAGTTPINVCLLSTPSRVYQGTANMLEIGRFNNEVTATAANPVRFCSADSSAPYTNIVVIDGQNARQPIQIVGNSDYIHVEDIWAHSSFWAGDGGSQGVIETGRQNCTGGVEEICAPNGLEFRRMIVWDTNNTTENVATINFNFTVDSVMEDIAVIQSFDRKTFSNFNNLRPRLTRIFAVWNGSSAVSVKVAFTCEYHSIDSICENIILIYEGAGFTTSANAILGGPQDRIEYSDRLDWNGENASRFGENLNAVPPEIVPAAGVDNGLQFLASLFDIDASVYVDTGFNLVRIYGTVGDAFQNSPTSCTNATDTWRDLTLRCDQSIPDCANIQSVFFREYDGDTACTSGGCIPNSNIYDKILAIGAGINVTTHPSQASRVTNLLEINTVNDYPVAESLYVGTQTPNMCFRTVDGVLTSEPLWPWPEGAKINAAYAYSGITPAFDVDAYVTGIYGAPPPQCTK